MVLTVDGLRMRYGDTEVLRDVSFQTRQGEVVALLGPNGAGKSTTIEILEGFRLRSAGQVEVLGVDPAEGDERWRSRLGIVLQSWRDHGNWRVRELLHHLGTFYAPYATVTADRPWDTSELLEAVGLGAHAEQKIKTLSGGQRRRLDVAIGIVGRPELLFLDEPTAGFDPEARYEFHDLVREVVRTCLQKFRKDVVVAPDGEEGLRIFKRYAADWALVVSDITMPKKTGIELYREIHAIDPDMRVILVSGDADGKYHDAFANDATRPLLVKKPFTLKSFADVVREHVA